MDELIIGAVVFCVVYVFILNHKTGEQEEKIEELEDRLTKLEKDAVKVTFSEPPTIKDNKIIHPKVNTDFESKIVTEIENKGLYRKPKK